MLDKHEPKLPFASTSNLPGDGKIKRAAARKGLRRRRRLPHPGTKIYGPQTPVRLCVTPLVGAELWLKVEVGEDHFYILHDCSLYELVKLIHHGGFWVWYTPTKE